ncbi:MAG: mannose-1-phosphate guanyltransferase [Verrucomicrobia bacterium]|nr:mannose-1-phosphate guanyltransferase [Verrucomicrobiota bacterium]
MNPPGNSYALILAGGSGTRFWPLSRDRKPKQLLNLFGTGTLLAHAIRRLDGVVPRERILILTNEKQLDAVRANAEGIPADNIFAEPAKRDTGPAVALGVGLVAARDPDAVMLVLPADQLIRDADAFRSVMHDALAVAGASDGLVTIGIQPTWPCPSYGYIERGAPVETSVTTQHAAHEVVRFREKPDIDTARGFLTQGGFSWNAGMFVWSLPVVRAQLAKHAPDLAAFIDRLCAADDVRATVAGAFPGLHARSIDYALMEKADRVLNIEATFDWDDVGSWISVAAYLEAQGDDNRANTAITEVDSRRNIVFNDRPSSRVALLGVEDLIVVQTEDALLVANRHQADAIKKLSELLPKELL